MVIDHLPMTGPNQPDRLRSADPGTPWVPRRTKPVILRGTGGAGADAGICSAVHGVCQDVLDEVHILGYDGSGEVVVHGF